MIRQFRFPLEKIFKRGVIAVGLVSVSICGCGLTTEPEARNKPPKARQPKSPTADAVPVPTTGEIQSVAATVDSTKPNAGLGQNQSPASVSPVAAATQAAGPAATKKEFTEEQLHKNYTLHMLALEPDIRALQLIKYLREYLTEDQKIAAVKLILEYDETFLELRRRRAAILENARDGNQVAEKLRQIKVETVIWSDACRLKVERNIMTEQQRQQRKSDREREGKG